MQTTAAKKRRPSPRKHDLIVQAASRMFLRHGYTHTSMDAIAAEAGVSKQTVYSYFKNKDALFCHMVEKECARHTPSDNMLANPALKPKDALYTIGHGFIDMISSPRGLAIHRLVMSEVERHPRVAKLFFDSGPLRMQELLEHYLTLLQERDLVMIDNIPDAASNFFAMIKGRYHLRLQLKVKPLPQKADFDRHIRNTVSLFLRIYAKDQATITT